LTGETQVNKIVAPWGRLTGTMAVWGTHAYNYDHFLKLLLIENNQESSKSKFLNTFFKTNVETASGGDGGIARNKPRSRQAESQTAATGKCLYFDMMAT